jgi:hypothetical protein
MTKQTAIGIRALSVRSVLLFPPFMTRSLLLSKVTELQQRLRQALIEIEDTRAEAEKFKVLIAN